MLARSAQLPPLVAAVAEVASTRHDDRPAFDALAAAHRASLYDRARKLCRGHLDPDDLVQDALERAFVRYSTLRDGDRARAWLFTVLTHTFIDRVRQRRSEPPTDPIEDVVVAAPAMSPSPVWERVSTGQLLAAVERLPAELREVYRLHALEGIDYIEVSARLGINKSTVGTRLLRARRLLREVLAAHLDEDGGQP